MAVFRQQVLQAIGATPSARSYFADLIPALSPVQPTGSGVFRDVTSLSEFNTAASAAGPGDVIRITAVINLSATEDIRYDGTIRANGTEAAPITITCTGVGEIRSVTSWTNGVQFPMCVFITDTTHVHVIGCKTYGSQFPIRLRAVNGTAGFPAKIWHNEVTGGRDSSIYTGSTGRAGYAPSTYNSIMYNKCHSALPTGFNNEGIYLGYGGTGANPETSWLDETHDIEVAYNEIYEHQGDGIDVKLGCYNINVHHNLIHDIGAHFGSGISTGVTNGAVGDNPNPSRVSNYKVHNNWIYNVGYNQNGVSSTNSSYGMYLARPGTECYNNVIWGLNPTYSVRGISSVSYVQDSNQLIDVYNNTIWVSGGNALSGFTDSGASAFNITYRNNLTADGSKSSTTVVAGDFAGPIPVVQSGPGDTSEAADNGDGPGSGFIPLVGATSIVGQATGTIPADDATGVSRPQGGASDRGAYELTA